VGRIFVGRGGGDGALPSEALKLSDIMILIENLCNEGVEKGERGWEAN